MITIGHIKSAIEQKLLESYTKNAFSKEIKNFKKLVLENKNISKLFFIYDELTSNKGLNESIVDSYINECITMYENTINKIDPKELNLIKSWIKDVKVENNYSNVDKLFSTNILTLESKIQSKKLIAEQLKKQPENQKDIINIPLSTSLSIANKTLSEHINDLSEEEKKEVIDLIAKPDDELKISFETLKEETLSKLNSIKENSDEDISEKIEDTIKKVTNENYNKLNYYRMKVLNENI
jgi:hypothetical protein